MIEILHPLHDSERIVQLRRPDSGYQHVDAWETALPELTALNRYTSGGAVFDAAALDQFSRQVVYPWRRTMVRLPEARLFDQLRTARNRYLITDDEQRLWSSALIGVAGLSVGSSVLNACSLTGAGHFRIADPDTLGPTNLNRLAGSVCDLGLSKTLLAQRRVLESNPYSEIEAFPSGYSPDSAGTFFGGPGAVPLRVVIEEMDDLAMKIDLRLRARASRVPVIMATDDGDNIILDVERYDLDPEYPLFHGRAGDITDLDPEVLRDPANRIRVASAIVGDDIGARMKKSLAEVGRTIPSWPQLGTAATLAGVVGALVARKLVCGDEVRSGRCHIRVDELPLIGS